MNLIGIGTQCEMYRCHIDTYRESNNLRSILHNGTDKKDDEVLQEAVRGCFDSYLSKILNLTNPRVMFCNSFDLLFFGKKLSFL